MAVADEASSPSLAARMNGVAPSAIRKLLAVSTRPGMISFAGGLPASDLIDAEVLAETFASVLRDEPGQALQYGATTGPLDLRAAIAERRGAAVDPDRLIITTGAQQALDLVARITIDPGDVVFVERPTYATALQTLRLAQAEVRSVPSSDDGMDPAALAEMIGEARAQGRSPKLLYLIPNFSNPAGWLVSVGRRRALLEIAGREGLAIVEDDPYGDLFFDNPPPPSLFALSEAEPAIEATVIYLGSLSKVVSPGIRVGWAVVPSGWVGPMTIAKQGADLQSSTINQLVAARYLASGRLEERLPVLRAAYSSRAAALGTALRENVPHNVGSFVQPQGGMFVWMSLKPELDADLAVQAAIDRGVVFVPGAAFFADTPEKNTLRLTFATATSDQIKEGALRLGAALRSAS